MTDHPTDDTDLVAVVARLTNGCPAMLSPGRECVCPQPVPTARTVGDRRTRDDLPMSDRGFIHLDPIVTDRGPVVRVYESSAADAPHVWLAIDKDDDLNGKSHAHLTAEQALRLRDDLDLLLRVHYQGDESHG